MTQFIAQLSVILDAVDVSEATRRLQTLASLLEDTTTDVVFAHHNGDVECNEAVEAECAASLNGMPSFHRITGNRRLIRLLDDLYRQLKSLLNTYQPLNEGDLS